MLDKIIDKQLSFFWRPEEIDLSKDRADFKELNDNERHIFLSNIKYQILLDSIQARAPAMFMRHLPEFAEWLTTWSFFETIHSRSYTHIIRNILSDTGSVFDDITLNEDILKRSKEVAGYYDTAILKPTKSNLFRAFQMSYILESIQFYTSFACSFAFGELGKMEGNAKIIRFIARDEQLHVTGVRHMMHKMGGEVSSQLFDIIGTQEKQWAKYLFKNGTIIGLNKGILENYIDYLVSARKNDIGIKVQRLRNPLKWMDNWLRSDNVQVAPQEVEVSSYLTDQVNSDLNDTSFSDFTL